MLRQSAIPNKYEENIVIDMNNTLKYDMIVTDFDGTLASSNNTISDVNAKAIREYIDAGGIFAISTGRMYSTIVNRLDELDLGGRNLYLMSYQGALATDFNTKETIVKVPMKMDTVLKILSFAEKRQAYCHIYSFEKLFIEKDCDLAQKYCRYVGATPHFVGKLSDYIKNNSDLEICKMLIMENPDKICALQNELNEFLGSEAQFVHSSKFLIECVDNNATKGKTVKRLANKLNIPLDKVMTVGDSMNDYSMIKCAGLGVAVLNAEQELKDAADMITVSNDNNAIAQLIKLAIKI